MKLEIIDQSTKLIIDGDTTLEVINAPTTLVIDESNASVIEVRNLPQGAVTLNSDRLNDGDIIILFDSPYDMVIKDLRAGLDVGAADITIKIDGAPILGLEAIHVGGSVTATATGDNQLEEGSTLSVLVANAAAVENFHLTLKAQGA